MVEKTLKDHLGNGWTVRFLDKKEFDTLKKRGNFGQEALRAKRMTSKWENSGVFKGALSYQDGKILALRPQNIEKWLHDRQLTEIKL